MTNFEIIYEQRKKLFQEGKIGAAGADFEEIHTYATWKKLGYQVKKGEHAIAKFTIWKYAEKRSRAEDDEEGREEAQGRMFPKLSFFFSPAQVEPIA